MLKRLSLKNFKVFKSIDLHFADVTILIGPQGVGKSTILDALYLLAQSSGQSVLNLRTLRFKDSEFADFFHKRDERESIEFGLELEFVGAYPPFTNGPSHTVDYLLVIDSNGFREQRAEYVFPERQWQFRTPRKPGQPIAPSPAYFDGQNVIELGGSPLILIPFTLRGMSKVDQIWLRSINELQREISDFLQRLHAVRTDRELLTNGCVWQGKVSAPFKSLTDVLNWLATNWDARDKVSDWLYRVVGRRIGFKQAGYQLFVEAADSLGGPYPIMNEGSGLRQLIWPFAALAAAEPGSVVAIEEPEAHLHPQAQAKLCELFAEVVKTEGKRLLLTTHSEHMLIGLLTAVARGDLKPEELAIYFLSMTPEGAAHAERLRVDEKGRVEGGLKGFFEAGLDELERYLEALSGKPGHET